MFGISEDFDVGMPYADTCVEQLKGRPMCQEYSILSGSTWQQGCGRTLLLYWRERITYAEYRSTLIYNITYYHVLCWIARVPALCVTLKPEYRFSLIHNTGYYHVRY